MKLSCVHLCACACTCVRVRARACVRASVRRMRTYVSAFPPHITAANFERGSGRSGRLTMSATKGLDRSLFRHFYF